MDKTQSTGIVVKNRQGFALMITLSVLSVIIALTMVLLSYFEKVQQDSGTTKALIQANVYYTNITNIFQAFKDKKTLFSVLYQTALPLHTLDDKFSLVLQCEPLYKGVNINWLGLENDSKKAALYTVAQDLFEILAQDYNIEDAGRLQEMLVEEIGSSGLAVLKEQSRLHQKNGIISYQQFTALVSRYQFEVDDSNIGSVPWKKYFSFSPEAETIDGEYSSAELISYLFEIELSAVEEWASLIDKGTLEDFVRENGGDYAKRKSILADKTFVEAAKCSVGYAFAKEQYRFRFEYIQGEAKHFEFYGKQ
ncbi:hypothetical protein [Sulfurovum sp.]|uniref:hypothetical protein n=1 Tax=Sulfurovum sp. TaxID=1969726 RepID=UPI0035625CCF